MEISRKQKSKALGNNEASSHSFTAKIYPSISGFRPIGKFRASGHPFALGEINFHSSTPEPFGELNPSLSLWISLSQIFHHYSLLGAIKALTNFYGWVGKSGEEVGTSESRVDEGGKGREGEKEVGSEKLILFNYYLILVLSD